LLLTCRTQQQQAQHPQNVKPDQLHSVQELCCAGIHNMTWLLACSSASSLPTP
jgi:hypothetical protein